MAVHAALAASLEGAEKGNPALSRSVFLALGGEFRREQINKQSGETVTLPFWPGTKDACMGVSFSTSANDALHFIEDKGLDFRADLAADGRWYAWIGDQEAGGSTFPLAACAALVKWRAQQEPQEA